MIDKQKKKRTCPKCHGNKWKPAEDEFGQKYIAQCTTCDEYGNVDNDWSDDEPPKKNNWEDLDPLTS